MDDAMGTSVPWVATAERDDTYVRTKSGWLVAKLIRSASIEQNRRLADVIVRAVNMHDDLVAALFWCLNHGDFSGYEVHDFKFGEGLRHALATRAKADAR